MKINSRHAFLISSAPALVLGLLFFGCARQEQPAKPAADPGAADVRIVATVNGDPVTLGEFQERFARAGLKPEKDVELQVKEEFLNRLIERKMMLREAQRRRIKIGLPEINKRIESYKNENAKDVKESLAGIGVDFEKWKSDVWEDIMIEKLMERDMNRHISVSSGEIKKYYQLHSEAFDRPEQVRARQIVVSTEGEAEKLMDLIRGGGDFAALARSKSTAPEADKGGDLGWFGIGGMPSEFNVVFGLPKSGVSAVVKSAYGFHIFKLEEKRKAGRIGLEEASEEIRDRLFREKQDTRYRQWLTELRNRTKFVVNYQALE